MLKSDYDCVITSTLSTETAQEFYKKHGYKNIGGFYYLDERLKFASKYRRKL